MLSRHDANLDAAPPSPETPATRDPLATLRALLAAHGLADVPLACGHVDPDDPPDPAALVAPATWNARIRGCRHVSDGGHVPASEGAIVVCSDGSSAILLDVHPLAFTPHPTRANERAWRVVLVRPDPDGSGRAQVASAVLYRTDRVRPRVAGSLVDARRAPSPVRAPRWLAGASGSADDQACDRSSDRGSRKYAKNSYRPCGEFARSQDLQGADTLSSSGRMAPGKES